MLPAVRRSAVRKEICQQNERDTAAQRHRSWSPMDLGPNPSLTTFGKALSCPEPSLPLGKERTNAPTLQGPAGGLNKDVDEAASRGLLQKACPTPGSGSRYSK